MLLKDLTLIGFEIYFVNPLTRAGLGNYEINLAFQQGRCGISYRISFASTVGITKYYLRVVFHAMNLDEPEGGIIQNNHGEGQRLQQTVIRTGYTLEFQISKSSSPDRN